MAAHIQIETTQATELQAKLARSVCVLKTRPTQVSSLEGHEGVPKTLYHRYLVSVWRVMAI